MLFDGQFFSFFLVCFKRIVRIMLGSLNLIKVFGVQSRYFFVIFGQIFECRVIYVFIKYFLSVGYCGGFWGTGMDRIVLFEVIIRRTRRSQLDEGMWLGERYGVCRQREGMWVLKGVFRRQKDIYCVWILKVRRRSKK